MRKLTAMNRSAEFDSKYVGCFLSIVFGDAILKVSSALGTASNFNDARHMPLDPIKLNFIEGMNVKLSFMYEIFILIVFL